MLVKSRKSATDVIPAKAGIQKYQMVTKHWTPAFAGVTTFYEVAKVEGEYFWQVVQTYKDVQPR